jgi:hypothetical protein
MPEPQIRKLFKILVIIPSFIYSFIKKRFIVNIALS